MKPEFFPVRQASVDDIPECLTILHNSILGHYFDPPLANQILTEAQADGELVVALVEDAVGGFFVTAPRGSFLVFPYLHLLAVKTEYQGQGIGARLLGHLEASLLGAPGYPFRPKVFLLAAQDNPRAVQFYERQGYTSIATIENMFAEGDTEYLMMKDLGIKNRPVGESASRLHN